jgi:hypothetical protein
MPSIWPCGGFGWLALRRRGSPVPETTSYSSDHSGAINTISYSDPTPAQPIEIDQLVQSAQLTPVIGLRCRQPFSNPRTRHPSRPPSASYNLCNPFNPCNLCILNSPYSSDLHRLCHPCPLPLLCHRKLGDIAPRPECRGHSAHLQSGGREATLEA